MQSTAYLQDRSANVSGKIAQRLAWTGRWNTVSNEDRLGCDTNVRNTKVTRLLEHHKLPKNSLWGTDFCNKGKCDY